MGSKWKKLKLAIGMNMCVFTPKTMDHSTSTSSINSATTFSGDISPSGDASGHQLTTPKPSPSGPRLSKSGSKSSKGMCAICLTMMKPGHGHAIFTAECSHTFHFHCITSNVKHGNRICPVCRAKWKEVPFQNPASSNASNDMSRINNRVSSRRGDSLATMPRRTPSQPAHVPEPAIFDDDESLDQHTATTQINNNAETDRSLINTMEIKTNPEVSAVSKSASHDNFAVLIHLKAPKRNITESSSPTSVQNSRAPIDLVTVLDVSGSMAGTKLALLKRAMSFVIQNLSSSDRLSVVAFSSTARRIFPLQRMTDTGRQQALQAVNSLSPSGGTNIAEGLRKGAKVFVDRRFKNPVGSIILLSDGQDTYTISRRPHIGTDYGALVPNSIQRNNGDGLHLPVHAFGFGIDHDATAMHSISEVSGGTFSFIEAEDVIQDAFAQCIGGLLSVVVQELQVEVSCIHPKLQFSSVKAGSYQTNLTANARTATIKVGDLYAEEERDFLATLNIPVDKSSNEMSLLIVKGVYRDSMTKEILGSEETSEVTIQRPSVARGQVVSIEVDRQRNRLRAAEAMAESRVKAELGNLSGAVSILENCQKALAETVSAKAGDRLCVALAAELKEMQERMANQRMYEQSGRAYVLSGLSSHSWQRATARGDSTESTSIVQAYQTPSMVDMVTRSQTFILGAPQLGLSAAKSFNYRKKEK
ncbi:hypothetical protein TanjilG_11271 [Lupinus angustifolius]|uniref:Anaphase-promoting complex subunit 11 n=1 Tax=Lupinus angustifolius TaxID=3871 RepID=A0A1J7I514_LUPAN|nr:PREDICTED: uncharacterized protein LOC109350998 [Lupinus angustifolius]OIW09133.1 hypothetical protein TanjilG_11271 [Lupinus angustifolius]